MPSQGNIHERLFRLERDNQKTKHHNRFLKLALLLTISFFAIIIFLGTGGGSELIVEKLTLVDNEGRVRALIATPNGEGGVWLYDHAGMERASVTVRDDDAIIEIIDSVGLTRVFLATEGQELVFRLFDSAGNPLFSLP